MSREGLRARVAALGREALRRARATSVYEALRRRPESLLAAALVVGVLVMVLHWS